MSAVNSDNVKLDFINVPSRVQSPKPHDEGICLICKTSFNSEEMKSKFCSRECSLKGYKVIKTKPKKTVNFKMVKNTMHIYHDKYKE